MHLVSNVKKFTELQKPELSATVKLHGQENKDKSLQWKLHKYLSRKLHINSLFVLYLISLINRLLASTFSLFLFLSMYAVKDRLCALLVRVPG
jgi:hypothetical protein